MLEIILVWSLAKKIAATCKSKGRAAAGWVVLFVFLWIGGEISGAVVGAVVTQSEGMVLYVFALLGAAAGAVIAFIVVGNLPEIQTDDEFYRSENYDEPPRRLPDQSYGEKFGEFRGRERNPDRDSKKEGEDPGLYRPEEKP